MVIWLWLVPWSSGNGQKKKYISCIRSPFVHVRRPSKPPEINRAVGCVCHPSKTPEINGAVGRCPSKNFWNQEGAGQATQQGTGSGLGLKPVPAGARPMRRTSTSPPSPSRISEADYA